jgi:hypothetical protein
MKRALGQKRELKNVLLVVIPAAALTLVLYLLAPDNLHGSLGSSFGGGSSAPGANVASPIKQGRQLLVLDRAPAGTAPVSYEYIMPEDQQRRVLREGLKLKAGDDVNDVLKRLGSPLKDNARYGTKDLTEPGKYRALNYYFAKRQLAVGNDFDPCVFVVFDERGKLFAVASNVADVPELNWGAGVTAYFGVAH